MEEHGHEAQAINSGEVGAFRSSDGIRRPLSPTGKRLSNLARVKTSERHLVMVSSPDQARCYFRYMPGPGPQLADFGEFSLVVALTSDEMEA